MLTESIMDILISMNLVLEMGMRNQFARKVFINQSMINLCQKFIQQKIYPGLQINLFRFIIGCTASDQCPKGKYCKNGNCLVGCLNVSHCAEGDYCSHPGKPGMPGSCRGKIEHIHI